MNKPISYFAGIDYSMSCPAVCFHPAQPDWDPLKTNYFFLTGKKAMIGQWVHLNSNDVFIESKQVSPEKDIILRGRENADNILSAFIHCGINEYYVGLEGYAFGASRSLVFNIAEHTCLLKSRLINNNNDELNIIAPTTAKKFATGKGNAKKDMMIESFVKDSGIDMYRILDIEPGKITAPINDIADAYWMCKITHDMYYNNSKRKK